jgi:hypothetical protein
VSTATFKQRLFDRNRRRDGRLVVRLRLGRHRNHEVAVSLIEAFQGFRCRATDHYPKSKVYLQREYHRASPLFDFRGLEATNAPRGTKISTGDLGQFKVVRCTITANIRRAQRKRPHHARTVSRYSLPAWVRSRCSVAAEGGRNCARQLAILNRNVDFLTAAKTEVN